LHRYNKIESIVNCSAKTGTNIAESFWFARNSSIYPLSGPGEGVYAPFAFPTVNRCCTALIYGRAGSLTAQNGYFWLGQQAAHRPLRRRASQACGQLQVCAPARVPALPGTSRTRVETTVPVFELISWPSLLISRARPRRQGERQANDFDDVLTDEEIKQFQLKVFQQPVRDSGGRPAGLRTACGGRRGLKDSCGVRSIRSPRVSLF
jgi:hypothetical protein